MKAITSLIFFLVVIISSNYSYCQVDRWKYLGESDDHATFFIDTKTIYRNSVTMNIECWIKLYPNSEDPAKNISYFIDHSYFNCANRTCYRETETIYYTDNSTKTFDINEDEKVIPDSMGETILDYLCKLTFRSN